MGVNEFINIVLSLIKEWRVLVTIAGGIFFMWIAVSIVTYKKRPKKVKTKKIVQEKPKEEKAETTEKEESAEN